MSDPTAELLELAPDPERARLSFDRLDACRDLLLADHVLPVAARLLGFSTAAVDLLAGHPEEAAALEDVSVRTRAALDQELAEDIAALGPEAGLRRFRRRALMRVAARDLSGAPLEEVVVEISDVAGPRVEAGRPPPPPPRGGVGGGRGGVVGGPPPHTPTPRWR